MFADIPGLTATNIGPSEVDPAFAGPEFDGLQAGAVSQDGNPVLKVFAGQLKSGSGDAVVHKYLENLSTKTRRSWPTQRDRTDRRARRDALQRSADRQRYAYAYGPTVLIAYAALGAQPATAEDALTEILGNLG